jgi:hypothetical protein
VRSCNHIFIHTSAYSSEADCGGTDTHILRRSPNSAYFLVLNDQKITHFVIILQADTHCFMTVSVIFHNLGEPISLILANRYTSFEVLLPYDTNSNHELVKADWCWWYWQYAKKTHGSLVKIAHVEKLMRKMRGKAYWAVVGAGVAGSGDTWNQG